MATQIHALAFKATVDNKEFKKGMVATRGELREAKKITESYKTAQEKLNDEFWRLDKLRNKGLITEEHFREEILKTRNAAIEKAATDQANAEAELSRLAAKDAAEQGAAEREDRRWKHRQKRHMIAMRRAEQERRAADETRRLADAERQLASDGNRMNAVFSRGEDLMRKHERAAVTLRRGQHELNVLLRTGAIDADTYQRELRGITSQASRAARAERDLARSSTMFGRSRAFLNARGTGIGSAVASALGARAIIGGVKESIADIDALNKTAQKLSVPIESLSKLSYVTAAVGSMSAEQTGKALQTMSRQISEASRGMGEGKASLEAMGLSAENLATMNMDQKFLAIANGVRSIKNEGDQLAIIEKIFGEEGTGMTNLLRMSNSEIGGLMAKAGQLGAVVGTIEADKLSAAAQDWADASVTWASAMRDIATHTAPLAKFVSNSVGVVAKIPEAAGVIGRALSQGRQLEDQIKFEAMANLQKAANNSPYSGMSESELDAALAAKYSPENVLKDQVAENTRMMEANGIYLKWLAESNAELVRQGRDPNTGAMSTEKEQRPIE